MNRKKLAALVLACVSTCFAPAASAMQPRTVALNWSLVPAAGSSSSFTGTLVVHNPLGSAVQIRVQNVRNAAHQVAFSNGTHSLLPGASVQVPFTAVFSQPGNHAVMPVIQVSRADGSPLGTASSLLEIHVEASAAERTSGIFEISTAVDLLTPSPFLHTDVWQLDDPEDVGRLPRLTVDDLGVNMDPGVCPPYDEPIGPEEWAVPYTPPTGPGTIAIPTPPPPPSGPGSLVAFDRVSPLPDGCVSGKLLYKSKYGDLRPAFGWTAVLHITADGEPLWPVRGEAPIDSNGEWSYCPPTFAEMSHAFMLSYETANDLVSIDLINSEHAWVPHTFTSKASIQTTPFFNEPGLLLPTEWVNAGDPNQPETYALGEVFEAAMGLFAKLSASGINAQRVDSEGDAMPYQIQYPNTTNGCNTHPDAWSCFDPVMERISLAPIHAKAFVVQHELGHAIEAHFWGSSPSPGGVHDIDHCTSEGLALTEGFANFLATWARADWYQVPYPDTFGIPFDIETPGVVQCNVGEVYYSEALVAATLWDLHDHAIDDADTLGMKKFGSVVHRYLAQPTNNLVQLKQNFRVAATPKYDWWVDDVFGQNLGL